MLPLRFNPLQKLKSLLAVACVDALLQLANVPRIAGILLLVLRAGIAIVKITVVLRVRTWCKVRERTNASSHHIFRLHFIFIILRIHFVIGIEKHNVIGSD